MLPEACELGDSCGDVFASIKWVGPARDRQVNQELGEIGGVFVSKQPSDTDMGAKEPKTDGWVRYEACFYLRHLHG